MNIAALTPAWPSRRARNLFREINDRGHGLPLASVTRDGGVEFRADLDISVWNPGENTSTYKRVIPGDFVIGLRSFQSGIGYSPLEGLVSPAYTVLRPSTPDVDLGYFRHLFKSDILISRLENVAQGIRQGRTVAAEDFYELRLPVPPQAVQRAIADYLDRETARIEALIAAKRRMTELLDERLQASISIATHARWVVEPAYVVPGRWGILPLKRCLSSSTYGLGSATQSSGTYAVLGMGNIRQREVVGRPAGFVDGVEDLLLLKPRDLLFNRTNSREQVGKVGLVQSVDEPTTFASYLVRLRVNERADANYLNYLLNAPEVLSLARSMALPSIGQANLNPNRYAAMYLPMPMLAEQRVIVEHLDVLASRVTGAKQRLERQVSCLQERRQALITAAVTGQLDIPVAA